MAGHSAGDFYLDSVGRRRKLSAGAMRDIRRAFWEGTTTLELAEAYRVSTSTIRMVCYSTPRRRDQQRLGMEVRFPG